MRTKKVINIWQATKARKNAGIFTMNPFILNEFTEKSSPAGHLATFLY